MSDLALKASLAGIAFALAGCAGSPDRANNLPRQKVGVTYDVANENVYLNPCRRENITPRPQRYVSDNEMWQRTRAGEYHYFYNGYYLFAQKEWVEKAANAFGMVASQTVLERMAREVGCENWIDRTGAAPQPQPDIRRERGSDRPINTTPRALDTGNGQYPRDIGPYSAPQRR